MPAAIGWLRSAVWSSLHRWDEAIPVEPFAFDDGGGASSFVAEYIVNGIRFEYIVERDESSVQYEALFHYPKKKRNRIFEREGRELTLQRGLGHLSGARELLTDRVLVLSIM